MQQTGEMAELIKGKHWLATDCGGDAFLCGYDRLAEVGCGLFDDIPVVDEAFGTAEKPF